MVVGQVAVVDVGDGSGEVRVKFLPVVQSRQMGLDFCEFVAGSMPPNRVNSCA